MAYQPRPVMAPNGHADIIAKLERAKRADRWLDEQIAEAVGLQVRKVTSLGLNGRTPGRYLCFAPGDLKGRPIPRYTASLDAALALVGEKLPGRQWNLGGPYPSGLYRAAFVGTVEGDLQSILAPIYARTAPLAVLLALFRALSDGASSASTTDASKAPGMTPKPNPTETR